MFNPVPVKGFGLVQLNTALVDVKVPAAKVVGSKHLDTTKTSSRKKSSPPNAEV